VTFAVGLGLLVLDLVTLATGCGGDCSPGDMSGLWVDDQVGAGVALGLVPGEPDRDPGRLSALDLTTGYDPGYLGVSSGRRLIAVGSMSGSGRRRRDCAAGFRTGAEPMGRFGARPGRRPRESAPSEPSSMFGRKPDPERERWYLLPAMQHGARRKFHQRLVAAIIVGSLTATGLAAILYFSNRL
jgi:hypothetical protein